MRIRLGNFLVFSALLAGLPFFFIGGPSYYASRSFSSAWNLGHILFFALLAYLCHPLFAENGRRQTGLSMVRLFFAILFLGIVIELIQMTISGRQPDPYDLLRNQLGWLLAVVFGVGHRGDPAPRGYHLPLVKIGVGLVLFLTSGPLLLALFDEQVARQQFPLLSDFETILEKNRWVDQRQLALEETIVRHGHKSLRVRLSTATYSGVSLFYFPRDWSGYQWLHFSVHNPEPTPFALHCRIHDVFHKQHQSRYEDRFHRRFLLQPGWNDLKISLAEVRLAPAGREMRMNDIERLGFFVVRQPRPLTIYLDYIYLAH